MGQTLAPVCKIQPSDDERAHLEETLRAFADAYACMHATIPARITSVMRMQAMLYYDVRGRFGLSSDLAQQAFVLHARIGVSRPTGKRPEPRAKPSRPLSTPRSSMTSEFSSVPLRAF
jgi:hypothetical protein